MRSRDRRNQLIITKLDLQQSERMKFPHQLHSTLKNWLKKQRTSSSTVVLTEDPSDFRPNFDPHYEFLRLVATTLSRNTVDHRRKSSVIASGMIDQCGPPCSCLRFSPSHDSLAKTSFPGLSQPRSQGNSRDSTERKPVPLCTFQKRDFRPCEQTLTAEDSNLLGQECSVGVCGVSFPTFRGEKWQTKVRIALRHYPQCK